VDKNIFRGQKIWPICKNRGRPWKNLRTFGQKKWANGQKFLKSGQPKTVGAQQLFGFVAKNPKIFNI
jgi:hypothetical protein